MLVSWKPPFVLLSSCVPLSLVCKVKNEPVLTSPFPRVILLLDEPFLAFPTAHNHYILCAHIICHFLSFTAIIGIPDIFFRLISAVI